MTDIATLITAVCAGVSVFGACLWWVVSTSFGLRAKLVSVEADVAAIRSEIGSIHDRCHGREMWLRDVCSTVQRIDKNVVKLAARQGVEIAE